MLKPGAVLHFIISPNRVDSLRLMDQFLESPPAMCARKQSGSKPFPFNFKHGGNLPTQAKAAMDAGKFVDKFLFYHLKV
jgi:hypothetical protein